MYLLLLLIILSVILFYLVFKTNKIKKSYQYNNYKIDKAKNTPVYTKTKDLCRRGMHHSFKFKY